MKPCKLAICATIAMLFAACNDFLDDNRFPLDQQVDSPEYWNNPVNVEAQLNELYGYYMGYGNGASWVNDFYYRSLSDNQCAEILSGTGVTFSQWKYQMTPETNSDWDDAYKAVRKCNTIIIRVGESVLPGSAKQRFLGVARLNRAYQYWQLVRCFGDVPLVETILDPGDEALYGQRTNRNIVMNFVLSDLDYAIENIDIQSSKTQFSKDMATAMKSEICLFEASYAKYHSNDTERSNKYFAEVIEACTPLMQSYSLCDNYRSLYNSTRNSDVARGFVSLGDNPEVIFMKTYEQSVLGHSMLKYLSSNTPIAGMTKDAFDAYLFKDGKPKALTAENNSDKAVTDSDDRLSIISALAVRDKRLSQTIDPYLAFNGNLWARNNSDPLSSVTGYTINKFINPNMSYAESTIDGAGFTCAPIFWLARIYLNYAEARAELGLLDDNDLNNTINRLYVRADLPKQTLASLSEMNDPDNDMDISSLLWEIRRCRRCELMFDSYTRYWDLVRWKQLHLLDTTRNPDIALGANVSNASSDMTKAIIVRNGYIDAAASSNGTYTRTFTEREYLYPIGSTQLTLNKKLTQNPGWK